VVPTPEISAAAAALLDGRIPQIDYEAFAADIYKLLAYIEKELMLRQQELESDDELALLLLM